MKVSDAKDVTRTMKTGKYKALDEAGFMWYKQVTSSGVSIRGVDIIDATNDLAKELAILDFKASEGWLWRFRRHHCLGNCVVGGEAASAPTDEIGPFCDRLCKLINDEGLLVRFIILMRQGCIGGHCL